MIILNFVNLFLTIASIVLCGKLINTFFHLANKVKTRKNLASYLGYFSLSGMLVLLTLLGINSFSLKYCIESHVTLPNPFLIIGSILTFLISVACFILYYFIEIKNGGKNGKH